MTLSTNASFMLEQSHILYNLHKRYLLTAG